MDHGDRSMDSLPCWFVLSFFWGLSWIVVLFWKLASVLSVGICELAWIVGLFWFLASIFRRDSLPYWLFVGFPGWALSSLQLRFTPVYAVFGFAVHGGFIGRFLEQIIRLAFGSVVPGFGLKQFVRLGIAYPYYFGALLLEVWLQGVVLIICILLFAKQIKNLYVGKNFVGDVPLTTKILAFLTSALSISVVNPTDLVKVLIQAEGKLAPCVPRHYSSALNAYSTIVRQTMLKIPGFTNNVLTHLLSGLGARFFVVCVGSPVDVMKSRMMGDPSYKGTIDGFVKTLKNDVSSYAH
ncbi:Mitochondrial brown fat uncoupling protein [Artemisia annua]|uniref:Mitochondrial brown fat uncoupling protein n=1 Tax=Artemisia annua TaxID=35608 RepID=A0A2U1N7W7_ARTAN|nr:Mitochondrial brown fat uncoupling protein [Artemisia annua]